MTGASVRSAAVLAVLAMAASSCAYISDQTSEALSSSGTVLVDIRSAKVDFQFPQPPKRPSAGQGAAAGTMEAVGATFEQALMDPFAIIMLPLALPVGAAIGAATVPDDAEWNDITSRYQRTKEASVRIYSDRRGRDTASEIETGIISAFRETSGSCIVAFRNAAKCRAGQPTSVVSVAVQPVINFDGYTLRTAIALSTPDTSKVACIQKDYELRYEVIAVDAGTPETLGQIKAMHKAFGRLLAFELYEGPKRRYEKDVGRDRMAAAKGIGLGLDGKLPCSIPATPEVR